MLPIINKPPLIYLISEGEMTSENFEANSKDFLDLLKIAVECQINFVQIREKQLSARETFKLTVRAVKLTKKSETLLLVNDRADIALGAGADGVHLTSKSLAAAVIRGHFPRDFIVGVSTHSGPEVLQAKQEKADFAIFGPMFTTPSKARYNLPPQKLETLHNVCEQAGDFPVLALGGIEKSNVAQIFNAGASGIAAIRFLAQPDDLPSNVDFIRNAWKTRRPIKFNQWLSQK